MLIELVYSIFNSKCRLRPTQFNGLILKQVSVHKSLQIRANKVTSRRMYILFTMEQSWAGLYDLYVLRWVTLLRQSLETCKSSFQLYKFFRPLLSSWLYLFHFDNYGNCITFSVCLLIHLIVFPSVFVIRSIVTSILLSAGYNLCTILLLVPTFMTYQVTIGIQH